MKSNPDYKSRFRILKGGKISLVVSALVTTVTFSTPVFADVTAISTAKTATQKIKNGSGDSLVINSGGSITTNDTGVQSLEDTLRSPQYITNNGTISITTVDTATTAKGIDANDLGASATITNAGGITVNSTSNSTNHNTYGIYVDKNYGTITNTTTGTITANSAASKAFGIYTYHNYGTGTISNAGTINVSTTDKEASGISSEFNSGAILNSGTINASSSHDGGWAVGIYVEDKNYATGTITNTGTITVSATSEAAAYGFSIYKNYGAITNTNTGTMSVSSALGEAYGMYVNTNTGTMTNAGNMTVSSPSNLATGIFVRNNANTGTITNSGSMTVSGSSYNTYGIRVSNKNFGTILNSGSITVSGTSYSLLGALSSGTNYGTITNSGSISITSVHSSVEGIRIVHDNKSSGTITNQGTINLTSTDGTVTGVHVCVNDDGTITNTGTITVDSISGYAFGIYAGSTSSSGTITNSGTITATKDGIADKNAFSIKLRSSYSTINNTGTLNGNIYTWASLTNSGTISLPCNANNAYISSFRNSSTGTLKIGLLTDGTISTYSKLTTHAATFESGSTISVNVLSASTNVDLLIGSTLSDVVSASTLIINGTLNVTDNSALVNFEYVQDGNTIDLNVVEGTTIYDSTVAGGGNSNTQAAGAALQSIEDSGSTAMNTFFSALNGLSTDTQVASAVKSTTPVVNASASNSSSQIMNGIQGIVEQRQGVNVGSGLNSGNDPFAEKTVWFKAYGSWGTQDSKSGINGFDLEARGAGLGFDGEYAQDSKLGLAFFYTDAKVEVNGMPQESDLDVYTLLLYGSNPVIDDKTKLLYQAGYSWQKTESTRYISLMNETAKADYTSKTASLNVKLLRDYKPVDNLVLQPLVEATYRNYKTPSYSESGATTNLSVDSSNTEEFVVGIGALAHYKIDENSKMVANIGVGYDLMDDDNSITSAYSLSPTYKFTTNGIDNGRWSYEAGIGYERQITKESKVTLMYNYDAQGSSYDSHSLSAKIEYKF